MSECLNMLLMYVVSLPMYVNVVHLCSFSGDCFSWCRLCVFCL